MQMRWIKLCISACVTDTRWLNVCWMFMWSWSYARPLIKPSGPLSEWSTLCWILPNTCSRANLSTHPSTLCKQFTLTMHRCTCWHIHPGTRPFTLTPVLRYAAVFMHWLNTALTSTSEHTSLSRTHIHTHTNTDVTRLSWGLLYWLVLTAL